TSSSRRGTKKPGLSEHWASPCVAGYRAAERAPFTRTGAKTSCRGGRISEAHRGVGAPLESDRQAGASTILFQRRFGDRFAGDHFAIDREISAQARVVA